MCKLFLCGNLNIIIDVLVKNVIKFGIWLFL